MAEMDISEKNLEETVEAALLAGATVGVGGKGRVREAGAGYIAGKLVVGGYHKRASADYDKVLCMLCSDVLDFIYATQAKTWQAFRGQHASEQIAKERFFQRLNQEIQRYGTLHVLRKGFRANGSAFDLAYYRPASGINPDAQRLYDANIFSVVRQLYYSEKNNRSLDMALFLNGLPLFTAELKNDLTGQTAEKNAIRQYREDRDPKEPLFFFGRCLAHFAVDPERVYMTTHLQGRETRFLPFNQGHNKGEGNPISYHGFATAYLWEQTWSRDSVLDLVQHFMQVVEDEDDKGKKTGTRSLIFPRYHQLDCVRRLLAEARQRGSGQRYLIQHSAGSGKSNSIAWLAHQLSELYNAADQRVFDSIIVITDRRILDRQLQRTLRQFEPTLGIVENIDKTSSQLKTALENGKIIIVTTLQKFPKITNDIKELRGKRFAVIIDEAHSSQSGSSTDGLKKVLAVGNDNLEAAEQDESREQEQEEDAEDRVVKAIKTHGLQPNVSYFAFTATPKHKTLELFGELRADGEYHPFSLYTMRQAIEEGFILDVLKCYVTYKAYWTLLKKVAQDPHYDRTKAAYILRSFVDLNPHTIRKKVEIIVEHFHDQAASRIGGRAKAMIVTRSRLHAVRYKQAVDAYLQERGYPYKALVAFSGSVKADGLEYTEAGMNTLPESQTAETFKQPAYRFLIVANKFQTGFDQPLLHSMYVDKKLGGLNAVQTLSRLNRTMKGKEETMVLDFANEKEEIWESFKDYYEETYLEEGTDPNMLYDLQTELASFNLYDEQEVAQVADLFLANAPQSTVRPILDTVIVRYRAAPAEDQLVFRDKLTDFVRLYAFLAQIVTFAHIELERLYQFSRLLARVLPTPDGRYPLDVQGYVDIESYRLQQTSEGAIVLPRNGGAIEPMRPKRTHIAVPEEEERLSEIIRTLNEHFGTSFTAEDTVCLKELEGRIEGNTAIANSVRVNSLDNARITFEQVVNDLLQSMMESNLKFYRHVNEDDRFSEEFMELMFENYRKKRR